MPNMFQATCHAMRESEKRQTMTRDMTRAQFKAALKRNGFRQVLFWFSDTTGAVPDISWGARIRPNGKIMRRETLAKLITERAAEVKKRQIRSQ